MSAARPTQAGPLVRIAVARTSGLRGLFAYHAWLLIKRGPEFEFERYDVVGRRARLGRSGVHRNVHAPLAGWADNPPQTVIELVGEEARRVIPQLDDVLLRYPYIGRYRAWPGPNCNTFVAYLMREVPELRTPLPPLCVGKDFLPRGRLADLAPSGTGTQLSLLGLVSLLYGRHEGIEIGVGGFVFGLHLRDLAFSLPGIGRIDCSWPVGAWRRRPGVAIAAGKS